MLALGNSTIDHASLSRSTVPHGRNGSRKTRSLSTRASPHPSSVIRSYVRCCVAFKISSPDPTLQVYTHPTRPRPTPPFNNRRTPCKISITGDHLRLCPRTARIHAHRYRREHSGGDIGGGIGQLRQGGKVTSRFLILKGRRPGFSCFFPSKNSVLYSCKRGGCGPYPPTNPDKKKVIGGTWGASCEVAASLIILTPWEG